MRETKANYKDIWQRTRETSFGFPYDAPDRPALSVHVEERQRIYETAWAQGGFRIGLTFNDLLTDPEANERPPSSSATQIRERVHDPQVAELLSPRRTTRSSPSARPWRMATTRRSTATT